MKVESIECFLGCNGKTLAELLNNPNLEDDPRFRRCGTAVLNGEGNPVCNPDECEVFMIGPALLAQAREELHIDEPTTPEEYLDYCDAIVEYYAEKENGEGIVPPCPNTGARRWLKGSYIPHITHSVPERFHHYLLMKKLDVLHFFKKTRWQISELFDSLSR